MAELTITLDTESGMASIAIDGTAISNVSDLNIYNYGPNDNPAFHFSMTTYETLDNGVYKSVRLSAKNDGGGQPSKLVAGYFEAPDPSKVEQCFANILKHARL